MATFDGSTYSPAFDQKRLVTQLGRVYTQMQFSALFTPDRWWTLQEISAQIGAPEASVSARLRDLRKERNGSHVIQRRRRGDPASGVWEYQLATGDEKQGALL
jgi:hypothetical protein